MKEDWTYKKLEEVCSLITKGTTPTSLGFDFTEQGVAFVKIESLTEDGGILPSMVAHISDDCNNALKRSQLEELDILYSIAGALGRVAIVPKSILPANTNQALAIIRLRNKEIGFIRFLKYFLTSRPMLSAIMNLKVGVAQQNLSLTQIRDLTIPIPPITEQSRIVSELDLLQSIIDKQKAQLKELDNLAQAVFYDMFGDPVENDKGWEVKLLSDVSELINGRAYKQDELLNKGKYKILRVGNFFTNGEYYYSDLELEDEKYCDTGDLLFAWSASFGAFIWDGGKVIYHYHIWKVVYDKKVLDIQYYRFLLNAMTRFFMKDVHGIGMVHLTKAGMEQYVIPIPPLSLQQSFAAKIESIEKQKTAIGKSIEETQKLFDYTMDKFFG